MEDTETSLLIFPLKIKRETWKTWKNMVPRECSMNAALIGLVENDISQRKEDK